MWSDTPLPPYFFNLKRPTEETCPQPVWAMKYTANIILKGSALVVGSVVKEIGADRTLLGHWQRAEEILLMNTACCSPAPTLGATPQCNTT